MLLDILALQQYRRPARRNRGKQLPLHLAVQLGVGRQRRIALQTVHVSVIGDAGLIGGDQRPLSRVQADGRLMTSAATCHDCIISERVYVSKRAYAAAPTGKVPQTTSYTAGRYGH